MSSDQPYLNLIAQLLNCPNGSELGILNANLNLLDERWEELMRGHAETLARTGHADQAQFLQKVVDLWENFKGLESE
jgi:hypothetical protein